MIRINLLEGATREAAPKPGAASSFPAQVFGATLLAAGALLGACYWYLNGQVTKLGEELEAQKREAARLAAIQAENTRYEGQLRDIQRRIDAIQTLQNNRHGPSELMTLLGGIVNRTAGLYLASVSPKDNRLLVSGIAGSAASIADFVEALRTAQEFQDVQLQQYFEEDREGQVGFKFNLDCVYKPPTSAAPSSPPAASPVTRRGT